MKKISFLTFTSLLISQTPLLSDLSARDYENLAIKVKEARQAEAKILWAENEEAKRKKAYTKLVHKQKEYLPKLQQSLGQVQKAAMQKPDVALGAPSPAGTALSMGALKGVAENNRRIIEHTLQDLKANERRKAELEDIVQNRQNMHKSMLQEIAHILQKKHDLGAFRQKELDSLVLESAEKAKDLSTLISEAQSAANHIERRQREAEINTSNTPAFLKTHSGEKWQSPLEGPHTKKSRTLSFQTIPSGLVIAPHAARLLFKGHYKGTPLVILEGSNQKITVLKNVKAFGSLDHNDHLLKGEPLGLIETAEKESHHITMNVYKNGHPIDFFNHFEAPL